VANINPDITPMGLTKHREVDLMYQLMYAFKVLCQKLDVDATVPATTYEANCFTALLNMSIKDTKGNYLHNFVGEENFVNIDPTGITDKARLEFIYQFFNMLETLCEQIDGDAFATATYESTCYTAILTQMVENQKGSILGNGNTFYFRPGGVLNQKELVEFYYNAVNAWETLCEKLDTDGGTTPPTDTDYEALCFTAIILTRVQNGAGNVVGNTSTDRG